MFNWLMQDTAKRKAKAELSVEEAEAKQKEQEMYDRLFWRLASNQLKLKDLRDERRDV